jgi:periplasmic protein CpxP/Spy
MTTELTTPTSAKPFRRLFNRYTVIAFVAGAALTAGIGAWAAGMSCTHGMMMGGMHSAADVSAHVDHVLKHLYVEIDATAAQKAQIDPLVKQAVSDMLPLHSQLGASHARVMQALAQTPVDRAALESARAEHLQFADQASKRFVQLIADVGDVLTPAQRKALTEHIEQMHGMTPHS